MSEKRFNWFDNVEGRPHPWPGLNWVTTQLFVKNVKAAKEFYEDVFHFVSIFEQQLPHSTHEDFDFVRMRYRGCNFCLCKEKTFEFDGALSDKSDVLPPIMFYVYVDDVDLLALRAFSNGCRQLHPVRLEFWGDKKVRLQDPFGYVWEFATRVQ